MQDDRPTPRSREGKDHRVNTRALTNPSGRSRVALKASISSSRGVGVGQQRIENDPALLHCLNRFTQATDIYSGIYRINEDGPLDGELPGQDDYNPYIYGDDALPDDAEERAVRRNPSKKAARSTRSDVTGMIDG